MALFSSNASFIGIDIGSSSIKAVELEKAGNTARLKSYGFTEISDNLLMGEIIDRPKEAAKIINKVCEKAGITSRTAVGSLPSFSVFSSVLTLTNIDRKDLSSAIHWEAKKLIPLPLEETILAWNEIKEEIATPGKDKVIKVLLTGAPKSLVKKYVDIFKEAKINLLSLETEVFSLVRSLMGNDKSTAMIVEMGATTTDLSIVSNSIPMFNRSLDIGGSHITKAVAKDLNISLEKAEQFKFDLGLHGSLLDSKTGIPKAVADSTSIILNEIKYSLGLYESKNNNKVDKIILSGGSSMMLNFANYLSTVLNMNVVVGDPWSRLDYPQDLKPLLQEIGPKMAVAIGLAMRGIE